MRFGLLGTVTVHDGERTLEVRGAKSRALLAALLFQANRPVSLGSLRNALWGEEQPASATASLHNHVRRLRQALAAEGGRLRSVPNGYLLRVDDGELDVRDFTALLGRARAAREERDWPAVSRHTAAAAALWRGEPLSDLPAVLGLDPEVRHLLQARLQVLEWRFEAELCQGRHAEAVPELARRVAEYPLHEEFHVQLITALYQGGRQADALSVFEEVRVRLAEELGTDPGPALRTVHQQVLVRDPALLRRPEPFAAVPDEPANSSADDDGSADEQLAASSATSPAQLAADTAASSATSPAQLPADTADFTGRADELRQLTDRLTAAATVGSPAVLVLSGMGGIGKTALAVHAAHRVRHLFPDGQLYVDLRGFGKGEPREPHDVLAGFLTGLGHGDQVETRNRPIPEHTDERSALLRTVLAARRVLLVLDNARDAEQVLPLLPGSGPCAVLVTTRSTLTELPGAAQFGLDPLDVEEQRALLSALCGPGRMAQDPDGALRLLAACAGHPLALRITGARLAARPGWPLGTLAQRLAAGDGRLRALSAGHLGVRATFASSYLALGDDSSGLETARAFRLLGLWPGFVFTVESAAALIGRSVGLTADLLEELVDVHLLQSPGPLQYRFHDLLGEYAAERVEEEETHETRDAARIRLMRWYAAALADASRAIQKGHGASFAAETPPAPLPAFTSAEQALQWCVQELVHIKETIRQAAHCSRPGLAWRVAIGLMGYVRHYWWTGEADACLRLALQIAERHDDLEGQAWLLRRIGAGHGMAYRTEQAVEALHTALALFEKIDDGSVPVSLLSDLSNGHNQLGRTAQALSYARQALERQRASGTRDDEGLVLSTMALSLLAARDFPAAETHLRGALELWRAHGNLPNTAITLANLGDALRALDRREEAFTALGEALAIQQRLGHFGYIADCLVITGRAHLHFAQWDDARNCFDRALQIARQHRLTAWIDQARQGLEELELRRG
ncbi:BTAD domain-containing putative transcriptional regulator [Kitasatospora sp. NPDC059599]|uniref:AfsR/SARP family transcriptional regulator n=1 Tax=Kitasatospora sp. NPDC059599 TaxID=3346880 RepID=UPI00369D218C